MLDQLALLVDKSLVVAESISGPTRYRLLETVRQYAQEKLGESGEAMPSGTATVTTTTRWRLHSTLRRRPIIELLLDQAEAEIDNLRAAFAWSRENSDTDSALQLATSLQPLWLTRGLLKEGSDWLDLGLADAEAAGADVTPRAIAQALADKAFLDNMRSRGKPCASTTFAGHRARAR